MSQRLFFSSQRVNENAMQPGQEQFLVDDSCVGGSLTVPYSASREQPYPVSYTHLTLPTKRIV